MNLPDIAPPLLRWYEQNRRILPFRTLSTPYRVWVSEIMLQQTRVAAALPYFERFMAALPTVADLAACDAQRLHKLWEGLGYYSRVRNLHRAAQIVVEQYGGALPADYDALLKLPGIGAYTAGAIASISFGLPVVAVDGNVLRVFARLLNDSGDIAAPAVKKRLSAAVQALQPPARPGDYNQALMELGALVCVPGASPLCHACPLAALCAARGAGTQAGLPVKAAPAEKKRQRYTVALVFDGQGRVLLQKRPETGLLAGLWQPVLLEGALDAAGLPAALEALGIEARVESPLPAARHVFTHLVWEMAGFVCRAQRAQAAPPGLVWATGAQVDGVYTLPGAFGAFRPVLKKYL